MELHGESDSGSIEAERRSTSPNQWQLALSTMGVAAIAIGHPMLDLLGRTPDFFIARAAPASDVVLLGVILGLGIPLVAAAVVVLTFRLRPSAGLVLHGVIMFALGTLLALSVLRQTPAAEQPWPLVTAISVLFGLLLGWGFHRFEWMSRSSSIIGVAPLLVAILFLFLSPSSEIAWGLDEDVVPTTASVGEPAPVVMVIFDEFPVASIIDAVGEIQAESFPAFAALSRDATWFRNAISTQQGTRDAIPAMLSGISQEAGSKLPHYADHPSTIFTLLSRDYQIDAIETLTQLCPENICTQTANDQQRFRGRWGSLGQDLAIVSGHLYLPSDLRGGLPPIDQNWGDFVPADVTRPEGWNIRDRVRSQVEKDRRTEVNRFLENLEQPLARNEFHFAHMVLPHRPWTHLPDGRAVTGNPGVPGGSEGGWGPNPFLVEQAYQRHLLQVQYADQIVGSIVSQLRSSGSYDDSILVIAADHGIAMRPDTRWRSVRPETVGDLAAVPLFIKAPHQERGAIDDYRAETVDIVPTVAGLLDTEVPWEVDGTDLSEDTRPDRVESRMSAPGRHVSFGVDGLEKLQVAQYHAQFFADRGPFGLAPPEYADLLGMNVGGDVSPSAIRATLDSPDFYADVDLMADHLPIVLAGALEGGESQSQLLAISDGSEIIALSQSWMDGDVQRFQALLPPDRFVSGANEFEILVVENEDTGYSFTRAGQTGS